MASGKAVVASSVGGMAEMIEDRKSGLLVTPGDAKEFVEKLKILIEDPEKRKRNGRKSKSQN